MNAHKSKGFVNENDYLFKSSNDRWSCVTLRCVVFKSKMSDNVDDLGTLAESVMNTRLVFWRCDEIVLLTLIFSSFNGNFMALLNHSEIKEKLIDKNLINFVLLHIQNI